MDQSAPSLSQIALPFVSGIRVRNSGASYNGRQLLLGLFLLVVGFFYYAIVREQSPAFVQSLVGHRLYVPIRLSPAWRQYIASFPSFVHVVAFALLTAGVVAAPGFKPAFLISLFWTVVNVLFELLQGVDYAAFSRVMSAIPWKFEAINQFVAGGVFDMHDMGATVLGGTVACITCMITNREGGKYVA